MMILRSAVALKYYRGLYCLLLVLVSKFLSGQEKLPYHLIAHRGGVVDSIRAENSLASLEAAWQQGFKMVEIDVRLTRDKELVIHHDNNFQRYFGDPRKVADMTWHEISQLKSGNHRVLKLEEALQYCSGKLQVMIDNKISGNDTLVWNNLFALLKQYNLYDGALTIGTSESTDFFRGRIRLSCTRRQLEDNMKRPDYNPAHYYLFGSDLSAEDVRWAKENNIQAVGVVNKWVFLRNNASPHEIEKQILDLKKTGLEWFQIDSEYLPYFTTL